MTARMMALKKEERASEVGPRREARIVTAKKGEAEGGGMPRQRAGTVPVFD